MNYKLAKSVWLYSNSVTMNMIIMLPEKTYYLYV